MGESATTGPGMRSSRTSLLIFLSIVLAHGKPRALEEDHVTEDDQEMMEDAVDLDPAINEVADVMVTSDKEVGEDEIESEDGDNTMTTEDEEMMEWAEAENTTETRDEVESTAVKTGENDSMVEMQTDASVEQSASQDGKCKKCIRPGFRARHGDLCQQCQLLTPTEENPLEKKHKRKCKKCSIQKFGEKHKEFCATKCGKQTEEAALPEPEHVPVTNNDRDPSIKTNEKKKKRKQNKETNKKKKDKKKKNDNHQESMKDEIPVAEMMMEEKPLKELGALETLIKYLIQQNTYT